MKTVPALFSILCLLLFCASVGNAQTLDEAFPTVDGEVKTICIHGNTLYIGGTFMTVGGEYRRNLAAIDIPTKSLKDWAPNPNDRVEDIKVLNGKVYFCGYFTMVHSSLRNSFAVVDSITGAVDPFNPSIVFPGIPGGMQTGNISKLAIVENTLYLAGYLISVNGSARPNIAAIDLSSGNLTPFYVNVTVPITALRIVDNTLYFGGPFTKVNGMPRNGFAAVDRIDGSLLPWAPSAGNPGNAIYSIEPDGETMILSGLMVNLNNSGHCFLTKIDGAGNPLDWAPFACNNNFPGSTAKAVCVAENYLIIGGDFEHFNGESRKNLVLMNKNTDAPNDWIPDPDNWVIAIAENDDLIAVGGRFEHISGVNHPHLAIYSKDDLQTNVSEPGLAKVEVVSGYPNPTQSTFSINLNQQDVKNILIYSKDGKIVNPPFQINGPELIVNTEPLQKGEYIVCYETKAGNRYVAVFIRS